MNSFGSKRKARVIKVDDPDEEPTNPSEASPNGAESNSPQAPLFAKVTRKPFRQSGLRKSINVEDASIDDDDKPATIAQPTKVPVRVADDDDEDGNVVIRPSLSRAGSTKQKKRKSASRLSFGVRADDDDEDAATSSPGRVPSELVTPKKKGDGGSLKKAVALKDLAMRSRAEDDDRPRYSKEYLEELQSSTPNTPHPSSPHSTTEPEGDEMNLDISELDGAVIVETPSQAAQTATTTSSTPRILTATEIREKKERRARLAHESSDFIAFSDNDDDELVPSKKKDDTRLVREDENLLEGFDDFVEDESVALGRKAEREARRKKRQEMESLIREAEGNSEEESDESDAERRAAFEAAQSRAGMDGLRRPKQDTVESAPKPKITPLPTMAECLQGLQGSLEAMRVELESKSRKVAELRREREEIRTREAEVQRLVDEAGEKYRAAVAGAGAASVGALEAGNSPAVQGLTAGGESAREFAAERGLESFGTPTAKTRDVDGDGDVVI
ncbi:uncharacterized protein DNG_05171 [Cephalotrichum gorgonifer]|uniref:Nineteen complex-related protein 2-domain-containing protein n=1 Tax=Cephalotrichum gorgonifer TaxID=2041049 RepID=A0AAE8MZY3_9PEZI|nr:uncharacterized protein DNG_05171 [Cephalotrichum gorgonifer]